MNRLLLLRHAKSSWDDNAVADIDRPLSARGERAARIMAAWIAAKGYQPDRILCSSAARTRQTLAILLPAFAGDTRIEVTRTLYAVDHGDYRDTIAALGGDAKTLLVIGHNPAIQATALTLTGEGDRRIIDAVTRKFPTGAMAILHFDAPRWAELERHTGTIAEFVTPRALEQDA